MEIDYQNSLIYPVAMIYQPDQEMLEYINKLTSEILINGNKIPPEYGIQLDKIEQDFISEPRSENEVIKDVRNILSDIVYSEMEVGKYFPVHYMNLLNEFLIVHKNTIKNDPIFYEFIRRLIFTLEPNYPYSMYTSQIYNNFFQERKRKVNSNDEDCNKRIKIT